jgi:hypothetical protein
MVYNNNIDISIYERSSHTRVIRPGYQKQPKRRNSICLLTSLLTYPS